MIDELPPDVRNLLDAERAVEPDVSVRAAVRSRLAPTIARASLRAMSIKILSVVAVITGVGGTVALTHSRSPVADVIQTPTASPKVAPSEPRPTIVAAERSPIAIASTPRTEAPRPVPVAPHITSRHRADPEPVAAPLSESVLLGRAWHAIADAEPQRALALVEQATSLYPDGSLAEEREVIKIQALAGLDRRAEAHDLATRFLAAHPRSVHRQLVHQLQESTR
jgi:hypothetical protein